MSKLEVQAKDLVLNSIIGKMYWHGETYADEKSLENMEAAYELALDLVENIYANATLAPNAVATISGNRLNTRAKEMIAYIGTICAEVERNE